ncbi:MAG TPA: S46 family peptidase [Candidatus Binatia bacterium]|nr:S46 family peptidase [Candidatus Binatia bacterium]
MKKNQRTMLPGMFLLAAVTLMFVAAAPLAADEGMWTLDNPPLKQLKEKYGFEPTAVWLEHIRLSSVRVGDGGSGSFVSPNGLVLTNHHVALGQLQKVSTPQKNYVADGFYAATAAEELPCPDLELNVLISMENVTAKVLAAVKKGMDPVKALEAKKAAIAAIESQSLKKTGLRSDVVTLYQGGEYWLYSYKKYTEVKLVFAPEQQAAFYGGDPDNFTYPRHDLDMALFRAYEKGKPARVTHYLKWSAKGAAEGELVFVPGHPGSTNRLMTLAQLQFQREFSYPLRIKSMKRMLAVAKQYAANGPEQARQAAGMIFGIENGLKVSSGEYDGLKAAGIMEKKATQEAEFRKLINESPKWKTEYADAWDTIAAAIEKQKPRIKDMSFRRAPGMRLGNIALQIVQYVAEIRKPDGKRLDGYHTSQLESLRFRLLSPAPVYPGMEEVMAVDSMKQMLEELGPDDPYVKACLDGKTPDEAAKALLAGTKLADPAVRKALVDGGEATVAKSDDSLIVLARKLDPMVREMRKWLEDNIESIAKPAGEKIGQARFAVYGKNAYPDATFTLRLSYGAVKGYAMNGTVAPYKTTFYGLYDRAASFDNKFPFHLPKRVADAKDKLDLATPLNFVCSGDIIGGNSGSPVINAAGEVVGLVFDGNIESFIGRFFYDDTANRTVSVHSAAMIEAMQKIYGAEKLVQEILGK